ncbi:MAG: HEAT repeat domain-containing protein [Pyrinomonadaceae bacterium]|nr:HEAT repeat domain-containing protein [Pyrinomonadaceae bacterium]
MLIKQMLFVSLVGLFFLQNGSCQTKDAGQIPPAKTSPTPTVNGQKQSEEQKKMDFLIKKILAKDPTAILMAKQLGSFASPGIKPLTTNEDDIVREIAIRSLNESGGGVTDVFVNALSDEMPTVRAAALNGLNNHLSEVSYPKLLQTYQEVSDPQHRKEIARLLGRIGGADVNDLRRICRDEQNLEALEGCRAALAKLGDPQARAEFLSRLREAKNRELKKLLEDVDYIKQLWALRGLMPVLSDKTPLSNTGLCQLEDALEDAANEKKSSPENQEAEFLRACDIAVNLIAKIANAKFPFPVNGVKNYDDLELAAARRILAELFSR